MSQVYKTSVFLDAWAYGSMADDSVTSGTVNYNVSPGVAGIDYVVEMTPGTYTVGVVGDAFA